MKYKKIIVTICILVLVIVGISVISLRGSSAGIVIGASLPLTGPSASSGERVKNAMNIAIEEVNKGSSQPIKIVYEDDKGDSVTAVSIVKKFINADHAHIIIGPLKSDPLLADAPITEQSKVILFSPTAGAKAISNAGDFVFRNIENPDVHGQKGADFFQKKGITNVALFTAKASNAQSYSDAFKESFEAGKGVIIYSASYTTDTTDFRTFITEAIKANAQGAYVGVATPKDAAILIKQMKELKFAGTILISPAGEARELIEIAESATEGVFVTTPPFNPQDPNAIAFAEKYSATYGSSADGFAANGYDAVKIIATAIAYCKGDKDTLCIRDYLYKVKDYPGVGGITTFDKNGDVVKPVQVKIIRNGQFISYQE